MRLFSKAGATAAAFLAAVTLLAGCTSSSSDTAASTDPSSSDAGVALTVLGASSTRVLNDDLQELTNLDLTFINAGSSTLVQQLADGSPGDLLITADRPTMDSAVGQDLVNDPVEVATNSLVMVVPQGNPAGITSTADLAGASVVLCDPVVPCGAISQTIIQEQNIEVTPVSLEHAVADVLGKVTSGEADAGWVYRTDAQAAGDAVEVIEIPGSESHRNSVMAATTTSTEHQEAAEKLLALLTSPEAAPLWSKHGFTPVTA